MLFFCALNPSFHKNEKKNKQHTNDKKLTPNQHIQIMSEV